LADLLGVTVEELVSILRGKKARVPFEIGAFVALEACEAMLQGPARIGVRDVRIGDDGAVSVFAPPNSASNEDAAKSVVQVLAHLLVAAGPGVPPVLIELVERGPADGRWDLGRLRDELEASLVPLNRQAARRVLSRMLREAARDGEVRKSSLPPPPQEDDVDAALDGLLDGDSAAAAPKPARVDPSQPRIVPTPQPVGDSRKRGDQIWRDAPPKPRRDDSLAETLDRGLPASAVISAPPAAEEDEEDYEFEEQATLVKDGPVPSPVKDDLLDELDAETDALTRGRRSSTPPPGGQAELPIGTPEPDAPRFEPQGRRSEVDLSGLEEVTLAKKGKGIWWALLFLVLSGGLLVGVALLRPDAVDRFMGNETPEEREHRRQEEERLDEQARLLEEHAARFGDLSVTATPEGAQVFLYVGRGPALVEQQPIGVAREFLVIPEGKGPSRAVVPADGSWETGEDGALYELPVQGSNEDVAFEDLVLGETTLPRDNMGAPTGDLGTIRVVTAPRDAKVYMLIGFSPSVMVQNQRTDQPVELLIWAENHIPERVMVGPSDWTGELEGRHAELQVELEPLEGVDLEEEEE
jgi:hypothetical protein